MPSSSSSHHPKLSYDDLVFQLHKARQEILALEDKMEEIRVWQKNYENSERKVSVNIELLYYECRFMLQHGDRFANFIIRDNKLCRIEAIIPG